MLTCMFQGKVVMAELDSLNQIASRVTNNEENDEALRQQLVSTIIVTTVQHKPWRFVIFTLPTVARLFWASVLLQWKTYKRSTTEGYREEQSLSAYSYHKNR